MASPEFNGALGTVEKYDASTRRWAVRIAGLFARRISTSLYNTHQHVSLLDALSTSLYMHSMRAPGAGLSDVRIATSACKEAYEECKEISNACKETY